MKLASLLASMAVGTWMLTAGPAAVAAEDDEISPDRPGIAESSGVVGRGRAQIEVGVQQEARNDGIRRTRTLLVPALFRIGASEKVELRIEGDTYTREKLSQPTGPGERSEGMAPTSLGLKARVADAVGGAKAPAAVIARFFPRSGTGNFKSAHATGDVRLVADFEVAPRWTFNPNIGIGAYEDDDQQRYTTGLLAGTLDYQASQAVKLFIDSGVQFRERRHGKTGAIVDLGVTYLVGRDTQLDVSIGGRVTGITFPRRLLSVGVSRRF